MSTDGLQVLLVEAAARGVAPRLEAAIPGLAPSLAAALPPHQPINVTLGAGPVTLAGGKLALEGQQQVAPVAPGLLAEFFNITPPTNVPTNSNFNTLSTLNAHLSGNTPLVASQTTASGKTRIATPCRRHAPWRDCCSRAPGKSACT